MFRDHFSDKLSDNDNHYILIGESHGMISLSAIEALTSCIESIKSSAHDKEGKEIIFISESLNNIERPYSSEDIALLEEVALNGKKSLLALIEAGVTLYGAETSYSNPFLEVLKSYYSYYLENFHGGDVIDRRLKIRLYNEVVKLIHELPAFEAAMIRNYPERPEAFPEAILKCEGQLSYLSLLMQAISIYSQTNDRIIRLNEIVPQQMLDVTKDKNNFLCLVGTGVTHLSSMHSMKDDAILEEGMVVRMQQLLGRNHHNVSSCYVTDSPCVSESYIPEAETAMYNGIRFSPVQLVLGLQPKKSLNQEHNRLFYQQPTQVEQATQANNKRCIIS
jgi:hypothetical protein